MSSPQQLCINNRNRQPSRESTDLNSSPLSPPRHDDNDIFNRNPKNSGQLRACIERILLEKRRQPFSFFCELFSHVILLLVLVFGFTLSSKSHLPRALYSQLNIQIPLKSMLPNAKPSDFYHDFQTTMESPLVIPDFDEYIAIGKYAKSKLAADWPQISNTNYGPSLYNLMFPGKLFFVPPTPAVADCINFLRQKYSSFNQLNVHFGWTEEHVLQYAATHSIMFALVVFREIGEGKLDYVIRQMSDANPATDFFFAYPDFVFDNQYQYYLLSGFLTLQLGIDTWAFQYSGITGSSSTEACSAGPNRNVFIPFPNIAYDVYSFYRNFGFIIGVALFVAFIYPLAKLTKSIVEDKETKVKDIMIIMGLSETKYELSWIIYAIVVFLWISISTAVIANATFFPKSSLLVLFLFFMLFMSSAISFVMFMSSLFRNARFASIVTPVIFLIFVLPKFIFLNVQTDTAVLSKIMCCLLSPTALVFGTDFIVFWEYAGQGAQFSNLNSGTFNFQIIFIMLLVDTFLYSLLTLLVRLNLKQKLIELWSNGIRDNNQPSDAFTSVGSVPDIDYGLASSTATTSMFEMIPMEMAPFAKIIVKDMKKVYSNGTYAVQNVSMTLLEGQVTCLLGSNGAGKSTLVNILSGLLLPSSGEVKVYGKKLNKDLTAIRKLTGIWYVCLFILYLYIVERSNAIMVK